MALKVFQRIVLFFMIVCIYWIQKSDGQLSPGKPHVCSAYASQPYNQQVTLSRVGYQNYRTCCKRVLRVCTSRCTRSRRITVYYTKTEVRYRRIIRYFCCSGWSRQGDSCPVPICNPGCKNGHCSNPNTCTCKSGYNGRLCENDINECATKPCDQVCTNLPGSFSCSCRTGYKKINNDPRSRQCANVNECLTTPCKCAQTQNCKATCTDTTGSFRCSCNTGFKLAGDMRTCQDVNECSTKSMNGCQHKCLNSIGSFQCACNKGYRLQPDKKSCKDIDECASLNGGCNQICTNKPGTFQCSCKRGFRLDPDGKTCKDINECTEQKPCDNTNGICKNTFGSYQCSCKVGFKMLPDKKTCKDIDECSDIKLNGCQHSCTNTIGSFFCSCKIGYRLDGNKRTCNDIDECNEKTHTCQHLCHNNIGSYKCSCRPGYRLQNDARKCQALPCQTINPPSHGNITCTGYVTDQSCVYECNKGFNLKGMDKRMCLPSSRWSGDDSKCERKICPDVEAPEHGSVLIPCVKRYGVMCLKKCSKGFYMDGSQSTQCVMEGKTTSWTGQDTRCKAATACKPNPCQNNGICSDTSHTSFKCDCSGTMYKGKICDIGIIVPPSYPQLVVNKRSSILEIFARPTGFVRITPRSGPQLIFEPATLQIEYPGTSATFRVTASKTGVYNVEYEIKGRNDFEFEQVQTSKLHVFAEKTSLLINFDIESLTRDKCSTYNISEGIELQSTCEMDKEGGLPGMVSAKGKLFEIPISLAGLSTDNLNRFKKDNLLDASEEIDTYLKTKEVTQCSKPCTNTTSNYTQRIDYTLNSRFFHQSFLKSISKSFRYWFQIYSSDSNPDFNKGNLVTRLMPSTMLKGSNCFLTRMNATVIPLDPSILYSVYQSKTKTTLKIMDQKFPISETTQICYVVDLKQDRLYISSERPISFISKPSPNHVIKAIKSPFVLFETSDGNTVSASAFTEIEMKMKTFDATFKMSLATSISENFFLDKFNSPNTLRGNGMTDAEIDIKFLGKKLTFSGKTLPTLASLNFQDQSKSSLNYEVSQPMNIDLPFSSIRLQMSSKQQSLSLKIPVRVSGGHVTGISNTNFLKMNLRGLVRNEVYFSDVLDLLETNIQDILKPKLDLYLKSLKDLLASLNSNSDVSAYAALTRSIGDVRGSYMNLKVFLEVLFNEYGENPSLVSAVNRLIRRIKRTEVLEVIPQMEDWKLVDTNGVTMEYSGKLCIYQLCFSELHKIKIEAPSNTDTVKITADCKEFNASSRIRFDKTNKIKLEVKKYMEVFRGQFTAKLFIFDKLQDIEISFNQATYQYQATMEMEGGIEFKISSSGNILNVGWNELVKIISGYAVSTSKLSALTQTNFEAISTKTKSRMELIQKRKQESKSKFEDVKTELDLMKKNANDREIEFLKMNSDYKKFLNDLKREQLRYTSLLRGNASLVLIEKDVTKVCGLEKCEDTCVPMMKCDVCQDPIKIPSTKWNCRSWVENVRTSQMVKINQICQETKYFFIPIYTGDCEEDPSMRGHREQVTKEYMSTVARGSSVGAMIGSVIPGVGSIIGGIIGGIVGAIGGLFSSCDESYEVITKKKVITWPCENYTMKVVITRVPKTSCELENIKVNGGFSDPKECNCRQEECLVKTTNLACSFRNKECQKRRKDWLVGNKAKSNKLYAFFAAFNENIELLEDQVDEQFNKAEKARTEYNFAVEALNRTINSYKIVEQESKLANDGESNQQDILRKEICILNQYNQNKKVIDLTIDGISFNTKLPFVSNVQLVAKIKRKSTGAVLDVPFVYQFQDTEASLQAASMKILYSTFCQQARKRRSLDGTEDVEDELAFTSWDKNKNSSNSEAACMTFKATTDYINDTVSELISILEKGKHVIKLTEATTIEIDKFNQTLNQSLSISVQSQQSLVSTLNTEINNYQNRSKVPALFLKWKEHTEIYTAENNFTVCMGFEDCIDIAFESLSNLPSLKATSKKNYLATLHSAKILLEKLMTQGKFNTIDSFLDSALSFTHLMGNLSDGSMFCLPPPSVKSRESKTFNINSGKRLTLKCGEVTSQLPVTYNWKHHDAYLDGEYRNTLDIVATVDKAGIYTCVVTSAIGQAQSEGYLVNVYEKPKLNSQPEDIAIVLPTQEQNVSFICDVAGYPRPTVNWFYKSFEDSTEVSLENNEPELELDNITKASNGYYYCKANNSYGTIYSQLASLNVLSTQLPRQYIEMSFKVNDIEFPTESSNTTQTQVFNTSILEHEIRTSENQNIALEYVDDVISVKVEVVYPDNATEAESMRELLKLASKFRQNLANSAAKLVNLIYSNQSQIHLNDGIVLVVDNTSLTYKATLNECNPGYQLHKNGIVCVECSAGTYNENGLGKCKPCPKATYVSEQGATRCSECENELKTLSIGSTSLYNCVNDANSVIDFVDNEISNTSANCFGYRSMHQKIRLSGLTTDRETVRLVLKNLDPDGVEERSRKKLRRRKYTSKGPNFTWHIDGYDKLKPYGFPIHACIDGFSRKIIWLKVGSTNNDPSVVGSYFLKSVEKLHKVPRLVRADRGSENVKVCGLQRFFRRGHDDNNAGLKSFLYGTSTSNQRIESWWSIFRKGRMNWWINFFKDLIDQNLYDPSIDYHVDIARLCFMEVLQNELDETCQMWNSHVIRAVQNSECPGGRPDILYNFGGTESGFEVTNDDIFAAKDQVLEVPFYPNQNLRDFRDVVAGQNNLSTESEMPNAKILFLKLIQEIDL